MRGYHCRQLETKTGFSSLNNNIKTTSEVICHILMMGKFLIQYFDKSLTTPRSLLPDHILLKYLTQLHASFLIPVKKKFWPTSLNKTHRCPSNPSTSQESTDSKTLKLKGRTTLPSLRPLVHSISHSYYMLYSFHPYYNFSCLPYLLFILIWITNPLKTSNIHIENIYTIPTSFLEEVRK